MKWNQKIKNSTLISCFQIFSKSDQKKILTVVVLQISLGFLDLLGVAAIGLIGALTVTGIQSAEPGNRVGKLLIFLHLDDFTFQQQTAILGLAATLILVGRTIFSIFFTRKILFFIAQRSAVTSGILIRKILRQNNLLIGNRTIQQTIYALTDGVGKMTLGVIGTIVNMIADTSLLIVMIFGLILVEPSIAISTMVMFLIVGITLYKLMHVRAIQLGKENANFSIRSTELINEVLTGYREALVRNRRSYYASEIGKARLKLSNISAEQNFMPNISKYVLEVTVILGAVTISAIQFALQDSRHAIATLTVFLAAGARIAPAVLRIQQGTIQVKNSLGAAKPTLELIATLPEEDIQIPITPYESNHHSFTSEVQVTNLTFRYPNSETNALSDITFSIPRGTTCAIVGPSGSGKTTLVDLLLGMFKPDSGQVLVSNQAPLESIVNHPGAIGYVPQDVMVFQGTIRENIALGFPIQEATNDRINFALEVAKLREFVDQLPQKLDSIVGPRGSKLSGGQRQRLGIARAIFTKPNLLILDESTSALDAQTELAVSEAIANIPYEITTVIIAHRLSTVRKADQVIYLQEGVMVAKGTFDKVRQKVANFDEQAKLMGL